MQLSWEAEACSPGCWPTTQQRETDIFHDKPGYDDVPINPSHRGKEGGEEFTTCRAPVGSRFPVLTSSLECLLCSFHGAHFPRTAALERVASRGPEEPAA